MADFRRRVPGLRYALWLVVLIGVLPWFISWSSADQYSLAFHLEYFVLMLRLTPLGLLFQLLATIPYVISFGELLSRRYLTYLRSRVSLRRVLLSHYARGAIVTFAWFFVVVFGLYGASFVDQPNYRNIYLGGTGHSPETYTTFSQVVVHGEWLFALVVAAWISIHAACYAVLSLSTSILFRNRALGLGLPWVVVTIVAFAMALLGLEAYGPDMVTPFNLTQLPWQNGLYELSALALVCLLVSAAVIYRAPGLDRFQ